MASPWSANLSYRAYRKVRFGPRFTTEWMRKKLY